MPKKNAVEQLDAIADQLDKFLNGSLYDIGFLEGTIDNPNVGKKIEHSFSGHALDTAIRAVLSNVTLFVTRTWDNNGNSMPRFNKLVAQQAEFIEARRKKKLPDWPDKLLEIGNVQQTIDALRARSDALLASEPYVAARLHRDEILAHLLEGQSGFRKKLENSAPIPDGITYRELIALSNETAAIVCEAVRIWKFSVKDPRDWIEHSKEYAKMFWHTLPVLNEVEEHPPEE